MRIKTVPVLALGLAFALAGCSGSGDDNASAAPVATTTTAGPTATATVEPSVAATTAKVKVAPAKVKVPDGVGLDYQSAQDLWRAAGLHVAPAVDATGAKRLPLIDANWVVVSQDPKAGTKVAAGSFVTATVKKYSDG